MKKDIKLQQKNNNLNYVIKKPFFQKKKKPRQIQNRNQTLFPYK